ncbi:hypothetical protein VOLCADRAFT_97916 [Volvox carteri f. nagariensis]|uniref:Uncharacterized protein n=1 Tax=Volvox carteri f. nagariensis TaxID=3068 RepID=D8UDZ2_VOLCA|nr:uncharacterized protein VOLCADRAFT_97916 [Volvox carteri f. nagariensis]EFJ42036.1 hypothetical protein VOLCADRAFT_97916 [Volvox carteri f. nagariensis]|eukprot:XP_002956911.1 hypothetical protein VOLCADRAFT_97916 [Volvox carteri f. nagariensis]
MHTNRDRNVALVFRPQDVTKHCAGVEAILIPSIPNHKVLFTASRDSTVKRWDVAGPEPALEASFEGHADWVNDLALIGNLLITCSNDHTVRLWRAGSESGHLLHTLAAHSDYVTRLAAAPECRLVVSAGLRGEVFSYDVERGLHTQLHLRGAHSGCEDGAAEGETASWRSLFPLGSKVREEACSVYSLALSPSAGLLAAGTSESLVRLLDPRTGGGVCKLRGHKDVVRALAVNSCGTKLLSGASDGTIKLWDVGMRRCVQTFQVHADSVWALLSPDDSLSYVYSAGRDRALFRTNTQTCFSELLALENGPVCALAVDPDARPAPAALRISHELAAGLGPLVRQPLVTIPGIPAIAEHHVLADQRRVLTRDVQGNVALWDVLLGTEMVLYGKADFDAKRRELSDQRSVPPWFTCDHRLGCLCITLSPSTAFNAEEYGVDVGFGDVAEHVKVNHGKLVLECVFAKWRHMRVQRIMQSSRCCISPGGSSAGSAGTARGGLATQDGSGGRSVCCGGDNDGYCGGEGIDERVWYYRQPWPKYWQIGTVPAVICSRSDGQRWRLLLTSFDGSETEPDDVPTWVADVVLRSNSLAPLLSKITFYLLPVKGSNLPTLSITRLQASHLLEFLAAVQMRLCFYRARAHAQCEELPGQLGLTRSAFWCRGFQVRKVAEYCCDKLREHGIHLEALSATPKERIPLSPLRVSVAAGGQLYVSYRALELTCNGLAVPYDMNLAAVKKFLWLEQDDLTFHYGVRDPAHPAPQPSQLVPSGG